MTVDVYINGSRHRLDPAQSVGKGGEADVYKIDPRTVAKIYKQPDHPDYMNNSQEAEGARQRLLEHQTKLREFPKLVGLNVKAPISLVTDRTEQRILGYTMEYVPKAEVLLRWSERSFRGATLDNNKVIEIFQKLWQTVDRLHQNWKVVIGDFNDLNILVDWAGEPFIIDADSFQFGKYLSRMYTERFVDPLHCDPKETRPILKVPHKESSDWYAYNVMLFRSLLLCDPFGGIYRPSNKNKQIPHAARPLPGYRISVFHKDVIYPKPAVPYDRLPDGLLDWFQSVFEGPQREISRHELTNVRWTVCTGCGTEHARPKCPSCQKAAPASVKETVKVRGKVTSTAIFKTSGEIVFAAFQGGKLNYLYRDGRDFKREDGTVVFQEDPGFRARYRIMGDYTLFGNDDEVKFLDGSENDATINVDRYGQLPVFDANEKSYIWCENGVLYRKRTEGPERIGDVLQNQTLFWIGESFGFGFYRAANLSMAFVFDVDQGRLNDTVKLPPLRGHLMDSTTFFTKDRVWFFATLKQGPKIVTRCTVIDSRGQVEGHLEEDAGTGILGEIRGKCAFGKYLFMVTDEGLCRLEVVGGVIQKTAEYPDAEPFVHSGCHLFPAKNGLHVVDRSEIRVLKMG
jgi:H/ACA ribonucleoprotein complex subunit 3